MPFFSLVYMKIIHANPKNEAGIDELNVAIEEGKPTYVLVYLEGCGPCNMTRPEWAKLASKDLGDVVIADVDSSLADKIKAMKAPVLGYPTIVAFMEKGAKVENFEDVMQASPERKVENFVMWIQKGKQSGGKSKTGGKWSLKYKRSINCRRPRGFSQRQYCKYGRGKGGRKTRRGRSRSRRI